MTDLIVRNEQFHEIPVRVIKTEGEEIIPLIDIARGIGYEVQGLVRIYQRNSEFIGNKLYCLSMTSGDQVAPTPHFCLNRDGIIKTLARLDYHRANKYRKHGYLYLVITDNGFVKIGMSKNLHNRMRTYSTMPIGVMLIASIECDNYHLKEKDANKVLKEYKICGEWCKLKKSDAINIFKKLAESIGGEIKYTEHTKLLNPMMRERRLTSIAAV
jgi:hypothetical protein